MRHLPREPRNRPSSGHLSPPQIYSSFPTTAVTPLLPQPTSLAGEHSNIELVRNNYFTTSMECILNAELNGQRRWTVGMLATLTSQRGLSGHLNMPKKRSMAGIVDRKNIARHLIDRTATRWVINRRYESL